ncbi:MAG: hypothetical protein ABSA76_12980 [Bacteroidales bacterium]
MKFSSGLFVVCLVAISGYSCRNKGDKNINQGEIHYTIEYMGSTGIMPKEVMPRNLIVSFKDNKILFDISAPFGNSGIMNLSNPEKGIYDTYISLLAWKYFYSANPGEPPPGFDAMKGMVVRKTSKTTVICGFNCKNAEVILAGNKDKVYQIWYTNEINIKNPNAANPYHDIEGVLMSFFFQMGTAEMNFTAETVYKKEIPDKLFERREKYMRVSKDDIDKFMNKMISL